MPETPPDLVPVGRVTGAHGTGGRIRLVSSTQPRDNILRYRPWLIADRGCFREVEVRSVQPHGDGFVARIVGVDDRDAAAALAGRDIAVPRRVLPELEAGREFYWQDLIGLAVTDQTGTELGRVTELIETAAHDVLVIGSGGRPTLIPFVAAFVEDVDLQARRIRVFWQAPA